MGTDISPILTIKLPNDSTCSLDGILVDLETQFDMGFEEHSSIDESTCMYEAFDVWWSNLTEDMIAFSAKYPGVLFQVQYEWPDNDTAFCEWFKEGKSYCDQRPRWAPEFDEAKLWMPVTNQPL